MGEGYLASSPSSALVDSYDELLTLIIYFEWFLWTGVYVSWQGTKSWTLDNKHNNQIDEVDEGYLASSPLPASVDLQDKLLTLIINSNNYYGRGYTWVDQQDNELDIGQQINTQQLNWWGGRRIFARTRDVDSNMILTSFMEERCTWGRRGVTIWTYDYYKYTTIKLMMWAWDSCKGQYILRMA